MLNRVIFESLPAVAIAAARSSLKILTASFQPCAFSSSTNCFSGSVDFIIYLYSLETGRVDRSVLTLVGRVDRSVLTLVGRVDRSGFTLGGETP